MIAVNGRDAEHAEVRDREGAVMKVRGLTARRRAPSASGRVSAASSASDFRSASRTTGTSRASSVATAMPTFTRE